jgi:leader peptidase (prepilin peptidase) / N-methyltransferase
MSPSQLDTLAMALVLGAIAANLGSFTTVLAHREGTGSTLNGRSHCPKCSHELSARDLIPILSWVLLRADAATAICRSRFVTRPPKPPSQRSRWGSPSNTARH